MNENLKENGSFGTNKSGDSLLKAKIREEDLAQQEEIRKFSEEYNKKINSENYEKFSQLLSKLEVYVKDNEEKIDKNIWQVILSLVKSTLNIFLSEDENKQFNNFINKKVKEKDRLFAIVMFMKSLLKNIFKSNWNLDSGLSWQERLIKEVAELEKRLSAGGLTEKEFKMIMERLSILNLIRFLGPVNFIGMVIRIISLLVGFALGVEISEQIIKEGSIKETNTKEESIQKVEIINNITYDVVNFLKSDSGKITDVGITTKFHESIKKHASSMLDQNVKLADSLKPQEKLKFEAQKTTQQEKLTQEKPVVAAPVVKLEAKLLQGVALKNVEINFNNERKNKKFKFKEMPAVVSEVSITQALVNTVQK